MSAHRRVRNHIRIVTVNIGVVRLRTEHGRPARGSSLGCGGSWRGRVVHSILSMRASPTASATTTAATTTTSSAATAAAAARCERKVCYHTIAIAHAQMPGTSGAARSATPADSSKSHCWNSS